MKHRPLLFLVLPLLLLAMMLASVRTFSGSDNTASAAARQVALDLDETGGWCNTIESTDTVDVGDVHKAAICVSPGNAIVGFNFELHFNNTLNGCSNTGQTGNGIDANPDLVALGTGWDCSLGGNSYPYCNVNNNATPPVTSLASMLCTTNDETVPVQTGWEPIAVITWTATAGGADALTWVTGSFTDVNYEGVTGCATNANCLGATVTKLGTAPEPTATSTALPTATATPNCGREGQEPCPTSTPTAKAKTRTPTPEATGTPEVTVPTSAPPPPPPPPPSGGQQPVVTPPSTGTGSGGIGWTGILLWTLTGGAAFSLVLGGGLYLRRATNR
jgi:hypothetical protein